MKTLYLSVATALVLCLSACTSGHRRAGFGYDTDVLCLGVDKTVYPSENSDGEIPDSAWEDFRFSAEYHLVDPATGARLSEESFASLSAFHDGLAVAADASGACFFIDRTGRRVIDAVYKDATLFSGGRAWVRTFNDEIIAIDRKGDPVFYAPDAVGVNVFYDGKSVIFTREGDTKVLDRNGRELLGVKGQGGDYVVGDLIVMSGDGGQGIMSLDGNFVLPPRYASIGILQWADVDGYVDALSDDRFIVLKDGGYGVVDRMGREILPAMFEDIVRDGDLFLVQRRASGRAFPGEAKWYDLNGNVVIDRAFVEAYPFGDGRYAAACDGERWGFIDREGNWMIEPRWAFVSSSMDANGRAVVFDNDSSYACMIDESGHVMDLPACRLILPVPGTKSYVIIAEGDKLGLVKASGEVLLAADTYDFSGSDREDKHLYIHID